MKTLYGCLNQNLRNTYGQRWWFERSDNKLIIHIIEPEHTEDELAILKTSFNEPEKITMKHSDTITIDHDNVSYILGRINSSELFCVSQNYTSIEQNVDFYPKSN